MKRLSYKTLEEMRYDGYLLKEAPERVLQFGEGNFLRAFADHFIDVLNEKADFRGKVVLVTPGGGGGRVLTAVNEQEGLYTLLLRGNENGEKVQTKRVISCVSRCLNPYGEYDAYMACAENPDLRFLISNTTEAGIVFLDTLVCLERISEEFSVHGIRLPGTSWSLLTLPVQFRLKSSPIQLFQELRHFPVALYPRLFLIGQIDVFMVLNHGPQLR